MKERERERGRERGWILFVARQPASLTSYFYHTYATFTLPVCSRRYLSILTVLTYLHYLLRLAVLLLPPTLSSPLLHWRYTVHDSHDPHDHTSDRTNEQKTTRYDRFTTPYDTIRHHTTQTERRARYNQYQTTQGQRTDTTRHDILPTPPSYLQYLSIPTSKSVPPISKWSR